MTSKAGEGRWTISYQSVLSELGPVRSQLSELLERSVLAEDGDARESIVLASVEAIANVIKHAHRSDGRVATLEVVSGGANVEIRVFDTGGGDPPAFADAELPDPLAESGRGLFFIRSLTDEARYDVSETGERCVYLRKSGT